MIGGSGIMDSQSGEGLDTERGGNEVNSAYSCQSSLALLPETDQMSLCMRNFRKKRVPKRSKIQASNGILQWLSQEGATSLLLAHRT